jgi:hypothetical protein
MLVKQLQVLCYSLFIDINNTLYCSVHNENRIISTSLHDNTSNLIHVTGTDFFGSSSYELDHPYGIFVNTNFDLYVADTGNSRIQLFRPGQKNGVTAAGNNTLQDFKLNRPTGVVLDADGYLFIADNSGGFRGGGGCAGCDRSHSEKILSIFSTGKGPKMGPYYL